MAVHIRKRKTASGEPRYQVRFRRGGRYFKLEHGGSFRHHKDARERADLVTSWLATGKNPAEELRALSAEPAKRRTFREWADRYEASREIDMADVGPTRSHLKRIVAWAGDRDPHSLSWQDSQAFVSHLVAGDMKPGSVRRYVDTFKLLLDYAGCDPNPARDSRVSSRAWSGRKATRRPAGSSSRSWTR